MSPRPRTVLLQTPGLYVRKALWSCFLKKFYLLIRKEQRKGESGVGERNIGLLFHLLVCSLVDSCRCPDWGSNLQPWCIGAALQPRSHRPDLRLHLNCSGSDVHHSVSVASVQPVHTTTPGVGSEGPSFHMTGFLPNSRKRWPN